MIGTIVFGVGAVVSLLLAVYVLLVVANLVSVVVFGTVFWLPIPLHGCSMYPTMAAGNIIVLKSVRFDAIAEDDVVGFRYNGGAFGVSLIVHRVVEVGDGYVVTKGDNNADVDGEVPADRVVGRIAYVISPIDGVFEP